MPESVKNDGYQPITFDAIKIGLASPETVELCWELKRQGFDLPLDALEPEECAQALYDLVKA